MTMFVVQLIVAWVLLIVLFTSAHALGGLAFGIELEEVSYGFGKALFRRGKVKIGTVPFGGYVKLKDTREDVDDEPDNLRAFNHRSRFVQAFIYLLGCAAMALVAMLLLAGPALAEVVAGFRQIIAGAFAPGSTAQNYIQATHTLWTQHGFVALLGLLAAKIAAFNLLPLATLSGGQAILALAGADRGRQPQWLLGVMNISIALLLALMCSWAYALVLFLLEANA